MDYKFIILNNTNDICFVDDDILMNDSSINFYEYMYVLFKIIMILFFSFGITFSWGGYLCYQMVNDLENVLKYDPSSLDFINYTYKAVEISSTYKTANKNSTNDTAIDHVLLEDDKDDDEDNDDDTDKDDKDGEDKDDEDKLGSQIILEMTPGGYVFLYYVNGIFRYWANSCNLIKYNYLETVARIYVNFFDCTYLFYDNCDDLYENNINPNNILEKQLNTNNNNNTNTNTNNCFYSKSNNGVVEKKTIDIKTNRYKYYGTIEEFFKKIKNNENELTYIGYNNNDIFVHNVTFSRCEFLDNKLLFQDNEINLDNKNINLYNVNLYNVNDMNFHKMCIDFSSKFFHISKINNDLNNDLNNDFKAKKQKLNDYSWTDFKNMFSYN